MRKLIALCFFTCGVCLASFAQDDDTIAFKHGLPETGEDTAAAPGLEPDASFIQISPEQVPQPLYNYLNSEPQFNKWTENVLLFDRKTNRYWLRMTNGKSLRTFIFTPDGKTVSIDERDISNE
jgi:hypothetical protein